MMKLALIAALPVVWAFPAAAQQVDHSAHTMPMPAQQPDAPQPAAAPTMPPMDHSGHDMSAMASATPTSGAPPVAEHEEPPPAAPADYAAERYYDPASMAQARSVLRSEHGGAVTSKVMANLFEYQARSGEDGYRWEGEAWFGGDINRLVLKSEGEGGTHSGVEAGEVQALYSRAVAPFTDIQAGVRYDFEPGPSRTYASLGFETVFPYWIEAQGALFLSNKGDLLARAEGTYDLRLTQRLLLQPRAELNFAAQNVPATGTGAGLSTAELGLRLRYEVRREFAPYVGVSYESRYGQTADYARAAGHDVSNTSFVVGIRAWF